MDRKTKTCHAGALLLLLAFWGTGLYGCGGSYDEKMVLPKKQTTEAKTKEALVIEIWQETGESPKLPETEKQQDEETEKPEKQRDGETTAAEEQSRDETHEGTTEAESEESADSLCSPSAYYAGAYLTEAEVSALGEEAFFYLADIDSEIFARMEGNSYPEGCPVALDDLRYLRVLHYDYDGNIRVGELVANVSICDDLLSIFQQLFYAQYPIEKMLLVDDYGGSDERSSEDNNTSCFNYRTVAGTTNLSRHATGNAIDINPVYNPYVMTDAEGRVHCAPVNGSSYIDRQQPFAHKMGEEDLCVRLFLEYGFTWGGSWGSPDYMHFSR